MSSPLHVSPVIERELRVASRRYATYWDRVGTGLTAGAIFLMLMSSQLAMAPAAAAGATTFRFMAAIIAVAVCTKAVGFAAESFAREKRLDTLGLLFLTPLSPMELAYGKLASASLLAFSRLVAVTPLLALPILAGGVTLKSFALLVLAILNLTFLGAAIGLYVSTQSWDEKRAVSTAGLVLMGILLAPVLLAVVFSDRRVLIGSPGYAIWEAIGSGPTVGAAYWISLFGAHGVAWLFFRATCRALPGCWRNRPEHRSPARYEVQRRRAQMMASPKKTARASPGPPPMDLRATTPARRAVRRQFETRARIELLEKNPALWLALRWRADSTAAWLLGTLGLVAFVVGIMTNEWTVLVDPAFVLTGCYWVNAALKLHVAIQASFAFARDRGENTLDLLLATPLPTRTLVRGHFLAWRDPLRPWIRRVLWVEAVWAALAIARNAATDPADTLLYAFLALAVIGLLVPDLYAVGWTGLWQGVVAPNASSARGDTCARVLVLPWLLAGGAAILANTFGGIGPWRGMGVVCAFWAIFSVAADWYFGVNAYRRLHRDLGRWALLRAEGGAVDYRQWRRAGRWLGRRWRALAGRGGAGAGTKSAG